MQVSRYSVNTKCGNIRYLTQLQIVLLSAKDSIRTNVFMF